MNYICLLMLVVGWSGCCLAEGAIETPYARSELYSEDEIDHIIGEARQRVVECYSEKGIGPAIDLVEEYFMILHTISKKDISYSHRVRFWNPATDKFKLALWDEANGKTGKYDQLWALELYQTFQKFSEVNTGESARYGPLASNIYSLLRSVGRVGEAHQFALEIESSLREKGLEADPFSYPDLGPWIESFPLIRDRDFPLKSETLTGKNIYRENYFNNVYFLALSNIASQALAEGDWQRAAELSIWQRRYTETGIEDRMTDYNWALTSWKLKHGVASLRLARIMVLHDEYGKALELCSEVIEKAYNSRNARIAECYKEALLAESGRGEISAVSRLREIYDSFRSGSPNEIASVSKFFIRVLVANGEIEQAWQLLGEADAAIGDAAPEEAMEMLVVRIELALDSGRLEGLEQMFFDVLNIYRKGGHKIKEPHLYELFARYKQLSDNMDEAMDLQLEASRLWMALNLERQYLRAFNLFESYRDHVNEHFASESSSKTVSASTVDDQSSLGLRPIQINPKEMRSVSLPGQPAFGYFYFSNQHVIPVRGEIRLDGPVEEYRWVEADQTLFAILKEGAPVVTVSRRVEIQPNSLVFVSLVGNGNIEEEVAKVYWSSELVEIGKATWLFSEGEESKRAAVINASLVEHNPFFLIPVYHTLQRPANLGEETTNIRVLSSLPVRLELVDLGTGKLVSVDEQGNGSFNETGDVIFGDHDRDGLPDIHWAQGETSKHIEVYFEWHGSDEGESLVKGITDFSIQLQDNNGGWRTEAVDRVELW